MYVCIHTYTIYPYTYVYIYLKYRVRRYLTIPLDTAWTHREYVSEHNNEVLFRKNNEHVDAHSERGGIHRESGDKKKECLTYNEFPRCDLVVALRWSRGKSELPYGRLASWRRIVRNLRRIPSNRRLTTSIKLR